MTRIGVSGHGGTGKTTLSRFLSARLALPFVDEGVQQWADAHPDARLWDLPFDQQLALQRHAIAYKIEHERERTSFVSDRTTVDAVSLLTLRTERLGRTVPGDVRDEALQHARTAYDVVILFEPNRLSAEPDPIAMLDATLRRREYDMTLSLYESLGTPIVRVRAMRPEEILPFVLDALRRIRIGQCRTTLQVAAATARLDEKVSALYLWGSVLSYDFLPAASDVDAVLVTLRTPAHKTIEALMEAARGRSVLFERFDLSTVSLDEWRRGERNGPLARIEADVFFSEMRNAMLVWGRGDLLPPLSPIPLERRLQLRLAALDQRLHRHARDGADEPVKYVLKELGFICHLHHQLQMGEHPFSYETLRVRANEVTRESVEALLAARANGWNSDSAQTAGIAGMLKERLSFYFKNE